MNKYVKLFFHRILKDFRQKELLPLKLLFFMHSSTILVLYPYLTIHMRELGINVEETAVMSAVTPVVAILMPPLAGMIADKIGNFRILLSFFSIVGGGSALLLLLVPVGRITVTFPKEIVFNMGCSAEQNLVLSVDNEYPCEPLTTEGNIFNSSLKIESCGIACHTILDENYTQTVLKTREYSVQMFDIKDNSTLTVSYTPKESDIHEVDLINMRNHMTLKNNIRYTTSVRKLSKNVIYFPTHSYYNLSCNSENSNASCLIILGESSSGNQAGKMLKSQLSLEEISHDDFEEYGRSYFVRTMENNNFECLLDGSLKTKHIVVTIPTMKSAFRHLDLGSCTPKCLVTVPRKQLCSNSKNVIELDMRTTFWSYMVVRVFVGIVSGTSFAMFEGAVIAILREHKADYGLQRIYATIGGMISSPLSGWMIDFASRGKSYTDFRPIFFLYASLKLISGILMLFINLEFKKAASSVVSDVIRVLKKLELITLFISCLILGCAWGFIESFLFWLLEDLGGSKSLMGLTITVGGIVGIPLLVLSGPLIKKIGHANVIFIGFVFYAIRLIGYSLIYNPWLCLIFEAMESITFGLSFTAAVTYAAKLSTVTTDTSIQGMLGGIYYGVGKGVGSLIGGYLIKPIGIRHTFQVFAVFTIIIGIIYFAFYHFYIKKRPSEGTDITKKDSIKPQDTFSEVNRKSGSLVNGEAHEVHPAVYEDAMCNPAYEASEEELEEMEKEKTEECNKA
ncbi:major facilitator superfamily domain-containing protein 6-like [Sitophilus oryzae]|uniref:Major facilitator superfamily domain-containing protein 6-like n=1 Tax=Sitophilus oryzae TaxID=7048 RepID=A0A6J2X594_SITOR|nr:major facilitator superfamily domain-containing protein 6-like [Sitophilus oryzae]XP_030746352.1 major facilitator superfamily domain-containing protein 6-like [Sitophilus oryzae]XP_030746353.1 major facilitator superfamily domain-containing protein 6-like [Sitophilus oryzae]